ncbi:MAG: excinuclease ABC subunit C, partial [Solirubrobacterales bacterium]|nr:excinuclease ABC subunit C [Solirubrobacterales bacterium]
KLAAAEQRYEDAARDRNRLKAVRSLLERQRVVKDQSGSFDAIAVASTDGEANAQVFQVRDGVLSDRQSFYLENAAEQDRAEVLEAFVLQYYAAAMVIPPLVVVEDPGHDGLSEALSERRGGHVEVRAAERGAKRRILELAERNARLALDQEKLRSERRRQQRVEALDRLQAGLGLDTIPLRIECYDISTLMGSNTVASMVVFEGAAPKKSDYRRFKVRVAGTGSEGPDDFASMEEILTRRAAQYEAQQDRSPHDRDYDASFAALPNLIVIDGGKGQLAAGLRALQSFRERGVTVISLAKRIEEVFLPGLEQPLLFPHDTPELQLLQRLRDEAHRFAITHHRQRRDQALTTSLLDEVPGVGPARKRALLTHFGSPEAVLSASRDELAAAPGIGSKFATQLHRELNRTTR